MELRTLSNFREDYNLVPKLKELVDQGKIGEGSEDLLVFTDNKVSESIFYKGSSNSSPLYDLIIDLRKAGFQGNA